MVDIQTLSKILRSFTPTELRFWAKVYIPDDPEGCWEWQGSVLKSGYGNFRYEGRTVLTHRFAWYLVYGKFPQLFVLHSCHNRLCCNPSHLREGTHEENMREMVESGRSARRGSGHNSEKLSYAEVGQVIEKLKQGITQQSLAKEFGVSQHTISRISIKSLGNSRCKP